MILKYRTRAAAMGESWRYVDRIRDVQTFGVLTDARAASSEEPHGSPRTFQSLTELHTAVEATWGPAREFDTEIWPDLPRDQKDEVGRWIESAVLRTDDGRTILALIGDECFLLGDDGRTIDRLR